MAPKTPKQPRFDPYKNFKFRVLMNGRPVAGLTKVAGLEPTAPDMHRRMLTDRRTSATIQLERGVTRDAEFEAWAGATLRAAPASPRRRTDPGVHTDLVIEMYDERGQRAAVWKVRRARVSQYQALPDLDANANAVAIEQLTLECEAWERDTTVPTDG